MNELTNLRVFSTMQYSAFGQCQGLLLVGVDEGTAEIFYCTLWTSEEEAECLLNSRYAALVAGSSRHDSERAEAMMEFDNLRALCVERERFLDELAENEAYPDLVGEEDVLFAEAFGETQTSLLTTLIERSKRRLLTIAGDTDI